MKKGKRFSTGDVIADQIDSLELRDGCTRYLRLRLYCLRDDWVFHLEFRSNHSLEKPCQIVEQMDLLKDVESYLLFEFDTNKLFVNPIEKDSDEWSSHHRGLENAVKERIQVFLELLDQRTYETRAPESVAPPPSSPRLWRLQGMM